MSGQVIAVHRAAEALGVESSIFTFVPGDDTAVLVRPFDDYRPRAGDVAVLNYGGRGASEDRVIQLPVRKFIYYHNVTPARFFARYGSPLADTLRRARHSLPELSHLGALAASDYNRRELERAGFHNVHVVPYVLDFDAFTRAGDSAAARAVIDQYRIEGVTTWLHVGRIVPNKRIEDIIRAFYAYHIDINPSSRLFLVGSDAGSEQYSTSVREWVRRIGIADSVIFVGQVGERERVAGFFRLADVYMCMSEHEGFCIPLLEAMVYHVPIIAYRSTGVVDTMGDAGVVVSEKDPRVLAAAADLLVTQPALRRRIIEGQVAQARIWHPDRALAALKSWLESLGT